MKHLRRTVLFELHHRLGARMTEFAGFEMPVNYSGIIPEHLAVRSAAGLFDLSHMGEFEVSGGRAVALLERALTNSAAQLRQGRAQYSLMCAADGGVIDDIIVYRLESERFMLCVNAANVAVDLEWLAWLNRPVGAGLRDLSDETALVAIQGPKAAAILKPLTRLALDAVASFGVAPCEAAGVRCVLARTGYTGEDGFELFVAPDSAARLFGALLEAGSSIGLVPCGLGARDTLRLEAGLPLYGHELDRSTTPLEAGLGAFVKFGRDFVGAEALAAQKAEGVKKRLVGIRTADAKSIARQGHKLYRGGEEIGVVTSGTFAPTFGRPLAMAYVGAERGKPCAQAGETVAVEIRKRMVEAEVTALPFYRRAPSNAGAPAEAARQ